MIPKDIPNLSYMEGVAVYMLFTTPAVFYYTLLIDTLLFLSSVVPVPLIGKSRPFGFPEEFVGVSSYRTCKMAPTSC